MSHSVWSRVTPPPWQRLNGIAPRIFASLIGGLALLSLAACETEGNAPQLAIDAPEDRAEPAADKPEAASWTVLITDAPTVLAMASEGQAQEIGRKILQDGGSAGDAVVAMSLALTVTQPSRMGLAGGGLCLIHDPLRGETETLDMMLRADEDSHVLPILPRGLLLLQGRTGRMSWPDILDPALELARDQALVSAPLAADRGAVDLDSETGLAIIDRHKGEVGDPLPGGETFLALTLLAGGSAQAIYGGDAGAQAAAALGILQSDLMAAQPVWRRAIPVPVGGHGLRVADPGDSFSPVAIGMASLLRANNWHREDQTQLLEAQYFGVTGRSGPWLQQPSTAVSAIDDKGQGVACIYSLGGLFGTGEWLADWGSYTPGPMEPLSLGGPALVLDEETDTTRILVTGQTGDWPAEQTTDLPTAPTAIITPLMNRLSEAMPQEDALATPLTGKASSTGKTHWLER